MQREPNECIYFTIDILTSYYSVKLSNNGFNKFQIYISFLRVLHLIIYYELGIFFRNYLESILKKIKSEIIFMIIFTLKLFFNLYYSASPAFFYGGSQYFNYSPITVITISILGILFWMQISNILEPLLGTNYYINIIANNTFSIIINHFFAIDLIKTFFAFISKNTKYCKDFDFKRFYSMDPRYIYIPNNNLQIGIFYFLICIILPIIIQKLIQKIKY